MTKTFCPTQPPLLPVLCPISPFPRRPQPLFPAPQRRRGKQEAQRGQGACLRAHGMPRACSRGFLGTVLQPGPLAHAIPKASWPGQRGSSLWLLCPLFADVEFCIIISILSLSIRTIIYSFYSVSVPRSPGSGPALLPRRLCQPVCLWENLVPELTGANKEALFLTVVCVCGTTGSMGTPSGRQWREGGGVPCRAVWTEAVLGVGVGDAIHWASVHAGQLTWRQEGC